MSFIAYAVLGIYTTALLYITIYCVMQFNLLFHYKKGKRKADADQAAFDAQPQPATPVTELKEYPFVTVQLPIFNEMYVVERLIDNIIQFDYPRDRFEVHILDDSTDETVEITKRKVDEYKALGYNIEQIRRPVRKGYKAGALKDGMAYAKAISWPFLTPTFCRAPTF
jgi:cellulose synthase/poly-beta-1,6-N-acetylglucosamine synthase-like glycosyltransferase